jgi:hypothetical protein
MGSAAVKPVSVSEIGTEYLFEREEAYLECLASARTERCGGITLQDQS